jgi:hypothetical protein
VTWRFDRYVSPAYCLHRATACLDAIQNARDEEVKRRLHVKRLQWLCLSKRMVPSTGASPPKLEFAYG